MKQYALDFIKLYLKHIVDTPNFLTLMQEHHELLTEIENVKLPITNIESKKVSEKRHGHYLH